MNEDPSLRPALPSSEISAVPANGARRAALVAASEAHRRAGLTAVTGAHYEGGHWLGSFAVHLVTRRGVKPEKPKPAREHPALEREK